MTPDQKILADYKADPVAVVERYVGKLPESERTFLREHGQEFSLHMCGVEEGYEGRVLEANAKGVFEDVVTLMRAAMGTIEWPPKRDVS